MWRPAPPPLSPPVHGDAACSAPLPGSANLFLTCYPTVLPISPYLSVRCVPYFSISPPRLRPRRLAGCARSTFAAAVAQDGKTRGRDATAFHGGGNAAAKRACVWDDGGRADALLLGVAARRTWRTNALLLKHLTFLRASPCHHTTRRHFAKAHSRSFLPHARRRIRFGGRRRGRRRATNARLARLAGGRARRTIPNFYFLLTFLLGRGVLAGILCVKQTAWRIYTCLPSADSVNTLTPFLFLQYLWVSMA